MEFMTRDVSTVMSGPYHQRGWNLEEVARHPLSVWLVLATRVAWKDQGHDEHLP